MLPSVSLHLLCFVKDGDQRYCKEGIFNIGFVDPLLLTKNNLGLPRRHPKKIGQFFF